MKSLLLDRDHESRIANDGSRFLRVSDLLTTLRGWQKQLPAKPYAINVCGDRLQFMLSMFAVITRGQCNLLPPNRQIETIRDLIKRYPDSYVIHDGLTDDLPDHPSIDCRKLTIEQSLAGAHAEPIQIPEEQLAAISFTSGSTGESRPNLKTWSMLRLGNQVNAGSMLRDTPADLQILTTVPPQHMYGLELSIMLPMTAQVCMHTGQPLFPLDIQQALEKIPAPRALVSTPQHLRALVQSGLEFPDVVAIYSATAPMQASLAQDVETLFSGSLIEIFGCSEIGSLARRKTAHEEYWTPFPEMQLTTLDGNTEVSADHIPEVIPLQDNIAIQADGRFSLAGRLGDLVNVAGKRGSLTQINHQLLSLPGVEDGVIFNPETDGSDPRRLAAMVVAPTLTRGNILQGLKQHLDPVFLPRPLLFVESLPRSETSKLPRSAVLKTFNLQRQKNN